MRRILIFLCCGERGCLCCGRRRRRTGDRQRPRARNEHVRRRWRAETYAQEIDAETRLVSWNYDRDRGGFRLLFETDSSTRITLTEAVQFGEGAGSGRIYQHRLPEGQTEIFVSVPLRAGQAAVTMTTPGSIANNRFSYVSTGQTTPSRPPISYERAQILILFSGIGGAGLTYRVVRKRREDEDKDVEQII